MERNLERSAPEDLHSSTNTSTLRTATAKHPPGEREGCLGDDRPPPSPRTFPKTTSLLYPTLISQPEIGKSRTPFGEAGVYCECSSAEGGVIMGGKWAVEEKWVFGIGGSSGVSVM